MLVFAPAGSAWYVTTHETLAEKIYYSMPNDVQQKLSLSEMRRGAAAPDLKFKDSQYGNHNYPKTYDKAEYWLERGKSAYQKGDYNYASYCFGVASHYISDSYVAPHSADVSKPDHINYEKESKDMKPSEIWYTNKSLESDLAEAYKTGKPRWDTWAETRNMTLVQQDLNNATSIAYSAIKEHIS